MGTVVDEGTGFYTPVWPQNMDAEVFQRNEDIATAFNNDIGELKAIILARGDRRANYTDMLDLPKDPNGSRETYSKGKYTYYDNNTSSYVTQDLIPTSKSTVMKVQAQLDQMVHSLMTEVNNILTGEKTAIENGKKPYYGPVEDDGTYPAGQYQYMGTVDDMPKELFVRLGTSRYDKNGNYYVYVPEDDYPSHADIDKLDTISNMKINPDLLKTPSMLGNYFVTADKQVDQPKADALVEAFNNRLLQLSPDMALKYDYRDYYSAMVGQVATEGSVYSSIVAAQQVATHNLSDSRDQVMGVSSNEELTNMIKYQNAYNAASRYITACNDMLENLIQNLA